MDELYRILIIIGVLAVQYFLSSRNNVYWGAVIPAAYIVFITWMFMTGRINSPLAFALILLIGLLFLIGEWSSGRKYLNQKTKKELDKIKTYDMR